MDDETLREAVVRTAERAKSNSHRIERLESETAALQRIAAAVEVLAGEQRNMSEQLASVARKVNELERLPVKRLEAFLGYFLTALASLLAGLLLSALAGG